MWREEKKCIYFSFLLQAEIFTPRSLNHLRGKWRTSRSLWNEESEYKWGKTDWGVDQDLLASLEGKEPHIHCTCCVLSVYKLYRMFTREKSDCFVIIFQGGLHLLYEVILAIQRSVFSAMISGWTLSNLVRSYNFNSWEKKKTLQLAAQVQKLFSLLVTNCSGFKECSWITYCSWLRKTYICKVKKKSICFVLYKFPPKKEQINMKIL